MGQSKLYPFTKGIPSLGDLPNPRIEHRSPALQMDSLPAEPQGKPKTTEVGNLSLLQRIFLPKESNQGLLHCRWIIYQLSYQGRLSLWTSHPIQTHPLNVDPMFVSNVCMLMTPKYILPVKSADYLLGIRSQHIPH